MASYIPVISFHFLKVFIEVWKYPYPVKMNKEASGLRQ